MMRGENGDLLGIKQKTADYLREDGSSGQIHHIDLVSEKIKDEAVLNQATNDAILANGGQSISQILANKAYQGMGVSASNLSPNSIIPMFSALGNGITGLFERVPMASLTSLEVKVSFSLNSLQTANNGVSQEASKIWNAVEDNFKKMEEMKEKMESAFKRFDEFMQLNRLIFDPLKNKDNVFKSFNSNTLGKLLA